MGDGGLCRNSGSERQSQAWACASFSYVSSEGNLQASSIARRSYSDLQHVAASCLYGQVGGSQNGGVMVKNGGGGSSSRKKKECTPLEMMAYNNYNVTEAEGGYYPCSSIVAGKAAVVGSWSLRMDPEVRRKGRLASYRAIAFEGKMKSSMRKSFKWLKDKCFSVIAHGGGHPDHHHHGGGGAHRAAAAHTPASCN